MTDDSGVWFARYCYDKKKMKSYGVHHRLFSPRRDELSVQLIDDLPTERVEKIGREVGNEQDGKLYGWGKISRSDFEQEGLTVCVDNNPRPGHTNIKGWPTEPDLLLKLRKKLANAANAAGAVCVPCCTAA